MEKQKVSTANGKKKKGIRGKKKKTQHVLPSAEIGQCVSHGV